MARAGTQRRWRISITREWCKGCSICVAFCPTKVLGMDDQDKAVVLSADACTGCMLCELRCPDLAIQVFGDGVAHGNVAGGAGDG